MRLDRTTGLDKVRFDELVVLVGERIEWNAPTGRPKALTLEQAVKATLIYFKNNVTEDVIAELMFVDQATISHVEVLGRDTAVLTGVHALGGGWPCP